MLQKSNLTIWLKGVLVLPLLSGLLMLFGWPPMGVFPALFIGLVPLFFAFDEIEKITGKKKYLAVFLGSFIAHFLWVGYSMKWLGTTSPQSYLTGVCFESLSLSLAMIPVIWFGRRYSKMIQFLFFAAAWLAVEFLNQNWLLGTPYLALGSGFGMYPKIIQHYEFIGVEGGSVWLLACNFLVYQAIRSVQQKKKALKLIVSGLGLILVPILISLLMYGQAETGRKMKISVLHTFMNSSTDDLTFHPEKMTNELFRMSEPALKAKSEIVVWPEVIIVNLGWLNNITQEKAFLSIHKSLEAYPDATICTGGYGYSLTGENGGEDPYASYDPVNRYYYLTHNIALSIAYGARAPMRSKQDFVPFQERIPLLKEVPFMASLADVVGANAKISYFPNGVEVHQTKNKVSYTPMLCYESVFPLKMAEKASEAELITISANEYWNKDLSGSIQYLYNNVVMAIQSRIPLAKSSNSGMSAIIDKKGNILAARTGKEQGLITKTVSLGEGPTLYSKISGVFYWASTIVFVSMLLFSIFNLKKPIKNNL